MRIDMTPIRKYKVYVNNLAAPCGNAPRSIYGAGCVGYEADIPIDRVIEDVRENLSGGTLYISDSEIEAEVDRAFQDKGAAKSEINRGEKI
jgi:hypothetical protein